MIKPQRVGAIKEGIVIDHLPPGVAWRVAKVLKLDKQKKGKVSLGDNHRSEKMEKGKGFIKIEGRILTSYEINLIALVAPHATINFIKEGFVSEKRRVKIPELLKGVINCSNLNCISNQVEERIISRIFHREGIFSCHYCKQNFLRKNIKI